MARLVDTGFWHVPGMQPQNWNEGVRFHTLLGATELTALYYNDAVNGGSPWSLRWTPYTNLWNYSLYEINEAAVTADRPLPIPASIGEYFPAVGRAEMLYINHENFESNKVTDLEGQRYSDVVKWMAAVDLDQAYAPWLTATGNLSANVEVYDQIVMDNCKLCVVRQRPRQRAPAQERRERTVQHRDVVVVGRLRADLDDDLQSEGADVRAVPVAHRSIRRGPRSTF